jgi:hypothetical protein
MFIPEGSVIMPNTITPAYPFDPTGQLLSNLITGEQQILTAANGVDFDFIVPTFAPYFADSLVITVKDANGVVTPLVNGIDYLNSHWFIAASRACSAQIYGSISIMNLNLSGILTLQYQTVGGIWTIDTNSIATILSNATSNPRITSWDEVTNYPISFPSINHQWDLVDMVGMSDLVNGLQSVEDAIRQQQVTGLAIHLADTNNPHHVTASQTGAYTTDQVDMLLNQLLTTMNTDNQALLLSVQNIVNSINSQLATLTITNSNCSDVIEDELYFMVQS